jgi:DNA primase
MLPSSKRKQSHPDEYYTSGQIASILQSCDIKVGGEIDTHFLLFCPFHYNIHTPACEIDKTNGMFICFSCGESGSIIDMVMKTTNRNYFEASRLIHSKRDSVDIERVVQEAIDTSLDYPEFDVETIERLHNNLLNDQRAKEYFYSRSILDESFINFKLGYSDKQDMVIVPVFDEFSRCLGFVARSLEGKSFKNSVGLPKSKVLFNLNKVKRSSIIVVESSFDVIRLNQAGFSAVATLGATVSRTQIHLLQQYAKSIIVCPDADDAGKKMVDRIVGGVKNKIVEVISLTGAKDAGDLSDQEMKDLFNKYSGNTLILAV